MCFSVTEITKGIPIALLIYSISSSFENFSFFNSSILASYIVITSSLYSITSSISFFTRRYSKKPLILFVELALWSLLNSILPKDVYNIGSEGKSSRQKFPCSLYNEK